MAAAQHSPPRAPLPAPVPSAGEGPVPPSTAAPLARRDLLAGALAVPLALPRHPELVSGSSWSPALPHPDWTPDQVRGDGEAQSFAVTKWDRALSLYRAAEAALAAVTGTEDKVYPERLPAGSRRDLYDRHLLRQFTLSACLAGRRRAALKKLLRTPVPTAAALAFKLDLTIEHLAWELTGGELCLAALTADAHRLS